MHFGRLPNLQKTIIGFIFIGIALAGCKEKDQPQYLNFATPYQGQNFAVGQTINIKLAAAADYQTDAVTYLVDGIEIAKKTVADSLTLPTKNLKLGYRLISAIVSHDGKKDTVITNVVLKSNIVPAQWSYTVVKKFRHDTSAYTQGLSFVAGKLLESTGIKGASTLRYVDFSGNVTQQIKLGPQYFGEGSVKVGDQIVVLTWRENVGLIFDAKTFKQLRTFSYQNSREGWGLTYDGKRLLKSDGSNKIWFLNAQTFKEEGYVEVYDNQGAVDSLNELEYINGKVFANIYLTSKIAIIDPNSGAVEAYIDANALVPKNFFKTPDDVQSNVLNGIAWDEKDGRLFIGGKKWPEFYELKLDKMPAKKL